MNLNDPTGGFTPVVEGFDHDYVFVGSQGTKLWFWTNYDAPNGRLIQIQADQPSARFWEEIIPEGDDPLRSVDLIDGKFLA